MYSYEQQQFLADHVWAVLATSRRDGSPQQALVGYPLDEQGRIICSTQAFTAKWYNAVREPKVCITVPDGRVNVVVYGTAEAITTDPERAELTADFLAAVRGQERPEPSTIVGWLDEQRRTVLRITPKKVLMHE